MEFQDTQSFDILDVAPDATIVVSTSGEILFANVMVKPLFGYEVSELIGQSVEILLPQRYRRAHLVHRRLIEEKLGRRTMGAGLELFGLRKDGSEFPVDISLSTIETQGGLVTCSAIRDMSSQLALSEQRFRAIFQQKYQLAGIVDLNGILLDANERSLMFSGVERRDAIGRPFWETPWWTHDPDLQGQLKRAVVLAAQGETVRFEATHPRPDASLATIDFSIRPVRDKHGNIVFLIPESQDVTERKHAELELRQSQEVLESRVTKRTAKLAQANEQLRAAKEIAESATATKTRFLAAASHDLRQPLQSIGLYASVLARSLEDPNDQEVLQKILASLDVMSGLLDALLDISKLDSGSITPVRSDFPIQELADRLIADNELHAKEKELTLRCVIEPCTVHSDPALLERIVENFLSNAIRYTNDGYVELRCERMDDRARISVCDSGIGIPEQSLKSIFEEYYQLDNNVRDRRKGLGLGLAIVKHIARLLDHELDVTSTVGHGSTFTIEVPLGKSQSAFIENDSPATEVASMGPRVVLLIDDDPAIVDATTMLLESADMKVHSAYDGDGAFRAVKDGLRPDIIVSDYRLPGTSGVDVIQRVREATTEELPTILMTGDTSTTEIEDAKLPHCTVLHKPVDADRLLAVIRRAIGV